MVHGRGSTRDPTTSETPAATPPIVSAAATPPSTTPTTTTASDSHSAIRTTCDRLRPVSPHPRPVLTPSEVGVLPELVLQLLLAHAGGAVEIDVARLLL